MTHVKNRFSADVFLADKIISFSLRGDEAAKLLEDSAAHTQDKLLSRFKAEWPVCPASAQRRL